MMKNKLYCLIGPSGSGKDAIKKASGLSYVISYRTRDIRPGEVDGEDGHFITKEKFKQIESDMIAKTVYSGHYYGITLEELQDLKDGPMIYVIDIDGYIYLKEKMKNKIDVVSIYIDTPEEEIIKRMKLQGRAEEEIKERLEIMSEDRKAAAHCDYIINNSGKLKNTIKQLRKITNRSS